MKFLPAVVGRTIAHSGLLAQKNSPEFLLGAGVAGMVGSTVLACRATLKMERILDEADEKRHMAKTLESEGHSDYSSKDLKKDLTLIYVQTGMKVVKTYAPAIALGTLSIAALTSSHNILNRRNAAVTAAYAALEKGFAEYRQRVVEHYGEDVDRDLRYGVREVEIEERGKKKMVTRVGTDDPSIYARFFDQYSTSWNKEPEYNMIFLKCQQNYANDLLRSRGHVFLNEVYDMLGIERSKAGAVVGWLLTSDGSSDNFINFGVFDDNDSARDFVNGHNDSILLDFNVDGIIFDKLDNPGGELSWQRRR